MDFSNKLNEYIKKINCSYKELAKESKLSKSTISRYCNGSRLPINPSEQLDKLINGLSILSITYNVKTLNERIIRCDFNTILKKYDFEKIIINFNELVCILKINISEFSKILGFDASYLSRIRSGKRKPADVEMFFEAICKYIVNNYSDNNSKKIISSIIKCPLNKIEDKENYKKLLGMWLCLNHKKIETTNDVNDFLTKLNDFDLNEYIRVIHFDDFKITTFPFHTIKFKNYYGIEEMKQGELDFFKSVMLSKNSKSIFMCSDMKIDDMAEDIDFGKKWMFAIAMLLKRGVHLNVIHNLNRPFKEMIIGLESWIPIYMTGQISSYYLIDIKNDVYSHLDYVSDNVSLTGECIKEYHDKGKYYLTNNKTEVNYFKEKSNNLLKKALPLINIYRENNIIQLKQFINSDSKTDGKRKIITYSLPIYTISDNLLIKILEKNNVLKDEIKDILDFVKEEKENMQLILKNNKVYEVITKIGKNEFEKYPISLELSKLFYSKKIVYTYNDYLKHFEYTKEYEAINNNYFLNINKNMTFRNIQILIHLNKWVMISKINNPTIHFVIKHPKLCKAIENFVAPIVEKSYD